MIYIMLELGDVITLSREDFMKMCKGEEPILNRVVLSIAIEIQRKELLRNGVTKILAFSLPLEIKANEVKRLQSSFFSQLPYWVEELQDPWISLINWTLVVCSRHQLSWEKDANMFYNGRVFLAVVAEFVPNILIQQLIEVIFFIIINY